MKKFRKFKHKKLGWVAEKVRFDDRYIIKEQERCGFLSAEIIEQGNDWQEVVEKDFEVLLYNKLNGQPHTNYENSLITCKENGCLPYSVKYIPSGKVWTLQDKTQFGVIEKFEIRDDKCWVFTSGHGSWLSELTEPKENDFIKVCYDGKEQTISVEHTGTGTGCYTVTSHELNRLQKENEELKKDNKRCLDYLKPTCDITFNEWIDYKKLQVQNTDLKNAIIDLQKEANEITSLDFEVAILINKINKLATK